MAKENNIRKLFSANVARLRKEAGISQKNLAEASGLVHNFINDIEKEKKGVSLETIGRLADALQVDPIQFFVNPAQWDASDNQRFLTLVDDLNTNINRLLDRYRKKKRKVEK